MKIVALYKTWDGGEFVDASLASIYDSVDAIVMVHSDVSWLGEHGNTVKPLAVAWCEQHDKSGKIHHLDVSLTNQEAQYAAGIEYIDRHRLGDVVMVVDADEIWEPQYIENARRQIHDTPYPAYRCNMQTYLKTPFFQVDPPYGSPTVFLTEPKFLTESPRGSRAPAKQLADVWMHHYTYVRQTRDDVERKLHQSAKGDGGNEVVVPGWMNKVYDKLPEGEKLHAFLRHRHVWSRIKKVWWSEVPPAMRTASMMRQWWPEGHLLDGELNAIHSLANGRKQAVDLGTYKGLSAVALALSCQNVHTVDCYEDLPSGAFADTLQPERYSEMQDHSLQENCKLAIRFGNITVEKSRTEDAGTRWSGKSIDVLFVDADHSEIATRRNVNAWLPHMAIGGRIILHDDNDIHPGVQAAIRDMRQDSRFRFLDPGEFSGSLAVCEVVTK